MKNISQPVLDNSNFDEAADDYKIQKTD